MLSGFLGGDISVNEKRDLLSRFFITLEQRQADAPGRFAECVDMLDGLGDGKAGFRRVHGKAGDNLALGVAHGHRQGDQTNGV